MRYLAIALMLLGGCGSADPEPTTCTPRSGLYKQHFAEESGSCGTVDDIVFNADTPSDVQGMGMVIARDACSGTVDFTTSDQGQTVHFVGTVKWAASGESGSAHLSATITSDATGTQVCTSIYTITFSRFQ